MISKWKLFKIFFRIGAFTIGGGYAMMHIIEYELVEKEKILDYDTFQNGITLSQTCPGPIAVNLAVFLGFKLKGFTTAMVCAAGTILPSFLIICLLSGIIINFNDSPYLEAFFRGIRPAVGAMIAFSTCNLFRKSNKTWYTYLILIGSLLLVATKTLSLIHVIIILVLLSILIESFFRSNKQ